MGKGKLKRFAENETFPHVWQPGFEDLKEGRFSMKGNWQRWFNRPGPITLELACGKGEYSLGLSQKYPNRNFIGMDVKGARLWKGAKLVQEAGIQNVAFVRQRIHLIPYLFAPEDVVKEVWIVFPDPQPRESKENKRLSSPEFLDRYRQFMPADGKIHLKTDSRLLFDYTLDVIQAQQLKLLEKSENVYSDYLPGSDLHIQTFYENLWLRQGRHIHYLCFEIGSPNGSVL